MLRTTKVKRSLVVILLACVSYGCVRGTVRPETRLDESELSRGVASGTSTVHEQAFLKTVGGDVKSAAGNMIYLCPIGVGQYLVEVARLRREQEVANRFAL